MCHLHLILYRLSVQGSIARLRLSLSGGRRDKISRDQRPCHGGRECHTWWIIDTPRVAWRGVLGTASLSLPLFLLFHDLGAVVSSGINRDPQRISSGLISQSSEVSRFRRVLYRELVNGFAVDLHCGRLDLSVTELRSLFFLRQVLFISATLCFRLPGDRFGAGIS